MLRSISVAGLERPRTFLNWLRKAMESVNTPSPRFIVSHYIFAEHGSLKDAETERLRLSTLFKKKAFKVYCVISDFDNEDLHDQNRKAKTRYWQRMFWPTQKAKSIKE